jgi:hypothetical protein
MMEDIDVSLFEFANGFETPNKWKFPDEYKEVPDYEMFIVDESKSVKNDALRRKPRVSNIQGQVKLLNKNFGIRIKNGILEGFEFKYTTINIRQVDLEQRFDDVNELLINCHILPLKLPENCESINFGNREEIIVTSIAVDLFKNGMDRDPTLVDNEVSSDDEL